MTPRQLLLELQSFLLEEYEEVDTEMSKVDGPSWSPAFRLSATILTSPYTVFNFSATVPESQYRFDRLVVDTVEGQDAGKQLEALNNGALESLATALAPDLVALYVKAIKARHAQSVARATELMKGKVVNKTTDALSISGTGSCSVYTSTPG